MIAGLVAYLNFWLVKLGLQPQIATLVMEISVAQDSRARARRARRVHCMMFKGLLAQCVFTEFHCWVDFVTSQGLSKTSCAHMMGYLKVTCN